MSEVIVDTLKHSGNTGTANVTLASNGNVSVAGALSAGSFTGSFGLFSSYALIVDKKSQNTAGGTLTQDTWNVRDLNHEVSDPDGIVSISSNKFTLGAGNYLIRWDCPAYECNYHQSRLYDVTNSAVVFVGNCSYQQVGYNQARTGGAARVTPTGSTEYRIEHNCSSTKATVGMGVQTNFGDEVFTQVEIYKEA